MRTVAEQLAKFRRPGLAAILQIVSLCAVVASSLHGEDFVVVFHGEQDPEILDGRTLAPLARPKAASGAVRAIGAPDPANPGQFLKIFVIGSRSVTTLTGSAPFEPLRTDSIAAGPTLGERSAQLTPDGAWMLVVSGNRVYAFDAVSPRALGPSTMVFDSAVTGVAVMRDSSKAFVSREGLAGIEGVNLKSATPSRLAGPIELAEVPLALSASPSSAGIFAAGATTLTRIDPFALKPVALTELAGPVPSVIDWGLGAPQETFLVTSAEEISAYRVSDMARIRTIPAAGAIREIAAPSSARTFVLLEDGRLFSFGAADASPVERFSLGVDGPVADIEASREALTVVFANGRVSRLRADDGWVLTETFGIGPASGAARITAPGMAVGVLEVFGGDHQAGSQGEAFERRLSARALDSDGRPVRNAAIRFSAADEAVTFVPETARTNLDGEASTKATPAGDAPFEVLARADSGAEVRFNLNPADLALSPLVVESGDYQMTLPNTAFPRAVVVRATADPPPSSLTIASSGSTVICPATALFNADRTALFSCTARPIPGDTSVTARVAVQDNFGRRVERDLELTVVSDASRLPVAPIVLTSTPVVGRAGERLRDAVRLRISAASGAANVAGVGVQFFPEGPRLLFDPGIARSDAEGEARADIIFPCELGQGGVWATASGPGLPGQTIPYEVVPGRAGTLKVIQGAAGAGPPGARLNGPEQILQVRLTDFCGIPLAGRSLYWDVSPTGAARLEAVSSVTGADGIGSATAVLGDEPGLLTVLVGSEGLTAQFRLQIHTSAAQIVKTAGDGQSVELGSPSAVPLTVHVLDERGLGVPGVEVAFSVVAGVASFPAGSQRTTNAEGAAAVAVQAGEELGRLRIRAAAEDLAATFELEVIGRSPALFAVGMVNAASYEPGLSPGSIGTIFGNQLMEGVDGVVNAQGAPLPTLFHGVRVRINGVEAPIFSMAHIYGQDQINVQVPFEVAAPSDEAVVEVENNGATSAAGHVRTYAAHPGVFQYSIPEGLFAAALHADGRLITPSAPARPGETIQLFWTGGGPTTPGVATNVLGPVQPLAVTANPLEATLDGAPMGIYASVYAPGLIGVYQANLTLPPGAPSGFRLLRLKMLGRSSPPAMLPVGP